MILAFAAIEAAGDVDPTLVAGGIKVALLGKEDRSLWTGLDFAVLYVHELCITTMLLFGAWAGWRAWRC